MIFYKKETEKIELVTRPDRRAWFPTQHDSSCGPLALAHLLSCASKSCELKEQRRGRILGHRSRTWLTRFPLLLCSFCPYDVLVCVSPDFSDPAHRAGV